MTTNTTTTVRSPKGPMTEPAARPTRKRLRPAPVFAAGTATFLAVLVLLGYQVAHGRDPALGHGFQKQKPKVVHRTVKRVIVTKVYDPEPAYDGYSGSSGDGYSGGGYSGGGYSGGGYSGGGSSSGYSAPAPAPAPAPSVSSSSSGGGY